MQVSLKMHVKMILQFQLANTILRTVDIHFVISFLYHIEGCVIILLNGVVQMSGVYQVNILAYNAEIIQDHEIKKNCLIFVMHRVT